MVRRRIEIFRHGEANYEQGVVVWNEANDLTEVGRRTVRHNACAAIESLQSQYREAVLYCSPYGRTIETALIIREEFNKARIAIAPENSRPFALRQCLQEQRYSYSLLRALATGGEIEMNGNLIKIDIKKSNPSYKEPESYGVADAQEALKNGLGNLSKELSSVITAMETGETVGRRMWRFMRALANDQRQYNLAIVVTHDALIQQFLTGCQSKIARLNPGDRMAVDLINNNFVIRQEQKELN